MQTRDPAELVHEVRASQPPLFVRHCRKDTRQQTEKFGNKTTPGQSQQFDQRLNEQNNNTTGRKQAKEQEKESHLVGVGAASEAVARVAAAQKKENDHRGQTVKNG